MKKLYGSIDITLLGNIVRQHPELIRKAQFKDGSEHQLLSIDIHAKRETDQYGNVAYIKATCKRDNQKEGVNYYLANLKESKYQDDAPSSSPSTYAPPPPPSEPAPLNTEPIDALPF